MAFSAVFWHGFVKKTPKRQKTSAFIFGLCNKMAQAYFFFATKKKEIFFSSQLKNYGLCSIEKS